MKSKNELKEVDIKNCLRYYFDNIIKEAKNKFSNILLDKNLHENISGYNISYKTATGPKPLSIRFNKIDGFVTALDGKIKRYYLIMDCLIKFVIRLNIL